MVTVRYWAGARRAAGVEEEQVDAATLTGLKEQLAAREALAAVVRVASFLVDGQRVGDDAVLADGAQVDVLPPFAGG